MVPGGGLFVPQRFPRADWQVWLDNDYAELAQNIFSLFLTDFAPEILREASRLYEDGRFGGRNPAPLCDFGRFGGSVGSVDSGSPGGWGVLELWHGPTAAFKDMALQMLPRFLTAALGAEQAEERADALCNDEQRERVLILTATSGDTGKAALEGFKDVPGTEIVVFYPMEGVSPVQEMQMLTTGGSNTCVAAVRGNFDECQSAVKAAFLSEELRGEAARTGRVFSSANSINWGRLLPQIVYYVWAYMQAVRQGCIRSGDEINVVVPTGNFGNILAASYARRMGLPLGRLICASNKNNVLSDFFGGGAYVSQRPFHVTMSPSMDILISSNFERYLFEASGRDGERVAAWFAGLARTGRLEADKEVLARCGGEIWAGWCGEEETLECIREVFGKYGYVLDPHSAVGYKVYADYRRSVPGDTRYTVLASTASPFKFAHSVLKALDPAFQGDDEREALDRLAVLSGWDIPRCLQDIFASESVDKPVLSVAGIPDFIRSVLL
jgi:threonine synthase